MTWLPDISAILKCPFRHVKWLFVGSDLDRSGRVDAWKEGEADVK